MRKKEDLSDFERDVVVGSGRAGLSISKPSIGFRKNKIKYPVRGSGLYKTALLMSEWLEMIERQR